MKSRRILSFSALLVVVTASSLSLATDAEPRKKVACFDLKAVGEVEVDQIGFLIDRVLLKVGETQRYETISRADLNAMLGQEKIKDALDCTDDTACLAEIGGAAGSDFLITGTVSYSGGKYVIILTLIDVPLQKAVRREEFIAHGGPDALWAKAEEIASRLVGGGTVRAAGRSGDIVLVLAPPNCEYRIDSGTWQSYVSGRLNTVAVTPGEHNVETRADGFREVTHTVFVDVDAVETVRVDLVPVFSPPDSKETGWIDVASTPEADAEIYLDGELREERTNATLKNIPVGKHHVSVRKTLFQSYDTTVDVRPSGLHKIQAVLQENFGPLRIDSRPGGAVVYIDGVNKGETPLEMRRVSAEAHKIRLVKSLYHDHSSTVLVEAGGGFSGTFELVPAFGTLNVNADKAGAQVLLDGELVGTVPVTRTHIPSGRVFVKVQKDLHRSHEVHVDIVDGQTATVDAELVEEYGTLKVDSTPKGASVVLDERKVGVTPLELQIGVGSYRLQVDAGPRYRRHTVPVQIRRGEIQTIDARLVARIGGIMIGSNAHGAQVFVDGAERGTAPVKVDGLFVGDHVIRLEHAKYESKEETVTVAEGNSLEREITLRKLMPEELRERILEDWRDKRSSYTAWTFVQLGGALAVGIAGGVLLGVATGEKDGANAIYADYQAATNPADTERLWGSYESRMGEANAKALAAEVLLVVAGAAVAAGITTFFMSPAEPETSLMPGEAQVFFAPGPNGPTGAVSWSWRW